MGFISEIEIFGEGMNRTSCRGTEMRINLLNSEL